MNGGERHLPARIEGSHELTPVGVMQEEVLRLCRSLLDGQESPESRGKLSLRDLLYVVFRHKWKIAFLFLLSTIASLLVVSRMGEYYKSEGLVYIRSERGGVVLDPSGEGQSFVTRDRSGPSVAARTEQAILKSMTVAERVVDRLGVVFILNLVGSQGAAHGAEGSMDTAHPFTESMQDPVIQGAPAERRPAGTALRQQAAAAVLDGLEVRETMGGSGVLRLGFSSYSPTAAQRILDTIMDVHLQTHIEMNRSPVNPEFFRETSDRLGQDLAQLETWLEGKRRELNVDSLDQRKGILIQQLADLEGRIRDASAEISASRARLAALESSVRGAEDPRIADGTKYVAGPWTADDPALVQLRRRLADFRLEEIRLRLRYQSGAKPLREIQDQIRLTQELIAAWGAPDSGTPGVASSLQQDLQVQLESERAQLEALMAREKVLRGEMASLTMTLNDITSQDGQLDRVERQIESLKEEQSRYLKSLHSAEISAALDERRVANVRILQSATLPLSSEKNRRKCVVLLVFGSLVGLGGGIGLAFLLERMNHSLRSSDQVEECLGLPVLAVLPMVRERNAGSART